MLIRMRCIIDHFKALSMKLSDNCMCNNVLCLLIVIFDKEIQ